MPVRGEVAELAATVNVTVPLPLPLAPEVTEIQLSPVAAVHAQPSAVVTVTDELVPDAGTDAVVGLTVNEHVLALAAPWLTVTVMSATVSVPLRAPPVFAAMLNDRVPLPLPLDAPLIDIHEALLAADQLHPAPAVTETERDAAAASTLKSSGVAEKVHVGSVGGTVGGVVGGTVGGTVGAVLESWLMVTVRPAIVTDADRSPPLLAATVSVTAPGPLPVAPDVTVTHDSPALDVHAQPASVSTAILVVPPDAPTFCPAGETSN